MQIKYWNETSKTDGLIIRTEFDEEKPEYKPAYTFWKRAWEKFERIVFPIKWVRVLLYKAENKPYWETWTSKTDDTELKVEQSDLEKLWKHGTVTQIEVTEDNIKDKAIYFYPSRTDFQSYPAGVQVVGMSKNIRNVEVEDTEWGDISPELKVDFYPTYQATKEEVHKINGKEQVVQVTTYQTFLRKKKRNIKLSRCTKAKKYKRNKIIKGGLNHGS